MKALKNIFVGLIISFVGSLPLGYLNIVGAEVLSKLGIQSLLFYLLGVISIEAVVIYFTVIFSNQLVSNKKLMKVIDFFAVFFLLLLACLFYYSGQTTQNHNYLQQYVQYSPFLIGFVLCLFNFLQIPFWMGWNLYLMNANHIVLWGKLKFYYILGTLIGTFFGMLVAIVALDSLSHVMFSFSKYIMPIGIPLFFIVLAFFQTLKVYKKHIK